MGEEAKELLYQIPFRILPVTPSEAFPSGASINFPMVVLTLRYGDRQVRCSAVLDSGAHFSVFPFSIGEALGLNVGRGKQATILNTNELVYFWNIDVTLEANIDFPLYAGFSKYADQRKLGILGQIGFFDRFEVRFDQSVDMIGLVVKSPDVKVRLP